MKLVAGRGIEPLHLSYEPNQSTVTVPRDKKSQTAGLEPTPRLERSWQTSVDYPVYQKPEKIGPGTGFEPVPIAHHRAALTTTPELLTALRKAFEATAVSRRSGLYRPR